MRRPAPRAPAVDITIELVRRLLRAQHPDLADLTLRVVATGWDNVTLRLGVDVPVPVRIGHPTGELPWGWSVVPSFDGTMVASVPVPARADGGLRAILDFADVTGGDPATDLATAWLTFDAAGRCPSRPCTSRTGTTSQ